MSNDTSLLEALAYQKIRERNSQTYMNAITKMTEKIIMRRITLQLQRGETLKPPDVNMSAEQFLTQQQSLLADEEEIAKHKQKELIEEKGYKDKTEYTFVTINPTDDVPLSTFKETIEKSISKTKWIRESDYAYVYEQRSSNPSEYSGIHCHLLIKTGDKPNNEIRRELKSKFKNVVDMEVVKKFDIGHNKKGPLSILPTADPMNRIKYMLDWKKDPDKHAKQVIDKEFRYFYNLQSIYFSGELFSQLILGHQECQQEKPDKQQNIQEDAEEDHVDIHERTTSPSLKSKP